MLFEWHSCSDDPVGIIRSRVVARALAVMLCCVINDEEWTRTSSQNRFHLRKLGRGWCMASIKYDCAIFARNRRITQLCDMGEPSADSPEDGVYSGSAGQQGVREQLQVGGDIRDGRRSGKISLESVVAVLILLFVNAITEAVGDLIA